MSNKLVSIIIPTYNRASLLIEAITSVQNQTYPAKQIIVADDGSQDNTEQIVAQYEGVEYYRQENKGQAGARNLGLKYAKGEYIASLDSDDIWYEDFLKVAVAALERFEADFVFLNWTDLSEAGSLASSWERSKDWSKYHRDENDDWVFLNAEQVRELFVRITPAPSSALLIRRSSFISNWNEEMKIADDWYLILEMVLKKHCRAAFTLTPYWLKHIHSENIYHGRDELQIIQILGLHDERIFARDFNEQLTPAEKVILKDRLGIHHFNYGRITWRDNGISLSALQSIVNAFKIAPAASSFYIAQRFYDHLKYRFGFTKGGKSHTGKITQSESKITSELLETTISSLEIKRKK